VDTSAAGTVRIKKKGEKEGGGKEESSGGSSIGIGALSSGMKAAKKNSVAIGAKVLNMCMYVCMYILR
jgi:hypothetical protein